MDDDTTSRDRRALGRALRELRKQTGMTQKEMTDRAGLDETYISRVEHGRIDVKWTTLSRFLRVLRADLHRLGDVLDEDVEQDHAPKD